MTARALLRPLLRPGLRRVAPVRAAWRRLARRDELRFWQNKGRPLIGDGAREWAYTEVFGIERDWYRGKRILDVGCGPRRSLDWAHDAAACVGLDPLAESYRELGIDTDAMDYVVGVAEDMPFDDASFDVVGSFNSLDHVDDVERTAAEIARVVRPGGVFLLATELNHRARVMEPQTFGWEVLRLFEPAFEVVDERRYLDTGQGIDESVRQAIPYDDAAAGQPGVLVAQLRRRS